MWWAGVESNRRHKDFQSFALPTELPAHRCGLARNLHWYRSKGAHATGLALQLRDSRLDEIDHLGFEVHPIEAIDLLVGSPGTELEFAL